MQKWLKVAALAVLLALVAAPVFAQDAEDAGAPQGAASSINWSILAGASFGAGLVMLGAGFGIGKIGASAVESMSRQPEMAGNIQTAMIISAALIEGATFFALVICLLNVFIQ